MAELPQVEAERRILGPALTGRTIMAVSVLRKDRVAHPNPADLPAALKGQQIQCVERSAKFLWLTFVSGDELVFHFRMTGALRLVPASAPVPPHIHLRLELDDGSELRVRDPRALGYVWFRRADEEDTFTGRARLGPDALCREFSHEYLAGALRGRRKALKTCLLDQTIVGGIGNIYADEILFEAGLSPLRIPAALSASEIRTLHSAIRTVLEAAIGHICAAPEVFFGHPYRKKRSRGWNAYNRSGKPCRKCGTPLSFARIGGRSSSFCSVCQPDGGKHSAQTYAPRLWEIKGNE